MIPTLLHKSFGLVKGVQFDSRRAVGSPMQAVKVYNLRNVDELVFLDVTATVEQRGPDFELVDELADECFMPLAVGGGIRTVEDVQRLLAVGADKVVIGSAALERSEVVREASERFGAQCVVVSIDTKDGEVWVRSGTVPTGKDPVAVAREMEALGTGEILLQSIANDGVMEGYDVDTVAARERRGFGPGHRIGRCRHLRRHGRRTRTRWSLRSRRREHVPLHRTNTDGSQAPPCRPGHSGSHLRSTR